MKPKERIIDPLGNPLVKHGMTMKTEPSDHSIFNQLLKLGLSTQDSIMPYYSEVRDRPDVSLLRCEKSGVILCDRVDHIQESSHYESQDSYDYWGVENRSKALNLCSEDLEMRAEKLAPMVVNKKWLDIGTGLGAILSHFKTVASQTHAVEPQPEARNHLQKIGFQVFATLQEAPDDHYDVISMFHVFEHIADPLAFLALIKAKLAKNGKVIIEVPHANDFLISFLDLEAFKKFTFWSEHLILHTRQSLEVFLRAGGFSEIIIEGYQRYPLANHLHWLAKEQPGGHNIWHFLREKNLDAEYAALLSKLDKTDTLFLWASK
jgi:SAM-dependent methyltransferase